MLEPQLRFDLENPRAAEEVLRSATTSSGMFRDSGLVDALYRRGRVRRELHKYPEALIDFRTALDGLDLFVKPGSGAPCYLNRANIFLETARVHTLTGELPLALASLELAEAAANGLEGYENWADLHLERARICIAKHSYHDAERHLTEALVRVSSSVLDAGIAAIHLELAVIKANVGEFETAHFCLKEAAGANPVGELALRIQLARGDLLWMQGMITAALWRYHQVRTDLEARVAEGAVALKGALGLVVERIEEVRAKRHELYHALIDELSSALAARDAECFMGSAKELATLAATFDEYPRARSLVAGLENEVSVAALAFNMLEICDALSDDTEIYERDFDHAEAKLSFWERDLTRLYFER
ncbi:MAG: hypothetical protein CO108_19780 [Deltaproteobacteria bacterium CG_4_9_14_3_um_filter_63_12]|nr:MAG: hypothetical protein CO108_19780 [Deltaproteobacteria bacterium CG_4_9_14_3_um_filter_63_12]